MSILNYRLTITRPKLRKSYSQPRSRMKDLDRIWEKNRRENHGRERG